MSDDDATARAAGAELRDAYDAGFAAARRGEEAAPGCTTTPAGRAFLEGYVDGARAAPRESRRESWPPAARGVSHRSFAPLRETT